MIIIGRWNVILAGVIPTPFEESWLRLNLNCNYEFEVIVFENVDNDLICLLMITKILCSCWLTVGSWIMFVFFLNTTIRWFKYVCIRKWTYKISPRFHSLTEMSRDRNDQDRKVPWPKRLRPKRLRPKRPYRISQTEKSPTLNSTSTIASFTNHKAGIQ